MRIVPGSDPERELSILKRFLEANVPWGAQVDVEPMRHVPGFLCPSGGPGHAAGLKVAARKKGIDEPFARRGRVGLADQVDAGLQQEADSDGRQGGEPDVEGRRQARAHE